MACNPGCSSFLLFCLATIASFMAELCFVPVLALVNSRIPDSKENFCWSWDFASPNASSDGKCPLLLLFLTALLQGFLLVITFFYIVIRKCTEFRVDGIRCCRFVLKYGTFVTDTLSFLLALSFIILILVLTDFKKGEIHYTGAFLNPDAPIHYRFALVCVGTLMMLIATILSGLRAFRLAIRSATDEYLDSGVVHTFEDYSRSDYEQINWDENRLVSMEKDAEHLMSPPAPWWLYWVLHLYSHPQP